MRLLKEDDVLDIIERVTNDAVENKKPKYLIQKRIIAEITALEPVDAETKNQGMWIYNAHSHYFSWTCTKCNHDTVARFNFCPNCGRRMVGVIK
jgi:hypothetical protein